MKKHLFFLLMLLNGFLYVAANPVQKLAQVNKQWNKMPLNQSLIESVPIESAKNFTEMIQMHLMLVVKHLQETNTDHLNANQYQHRKELLTKLELYAINGIFPTNDFLTYQNPVFIDRKGVHCAVGYLMQQSGFESLAQEINATQRFAYVDEIIHPQLKIWAADQGFTQEELAWIQPGYLSDLGMNKVSDGLNGEVLAMATINANTSIIGGTFTKELKNNQTCNNIALITYNGTDYEISPILNGVNGKVMSLYVDGDFVYIGGDFTNANGVPVKNITRLNLLSSAQPYSHIGEMINPVLAITKYNNEFLAASKSTSDLLMKWDGNITWTEANTGLYGNEIRCFKLFENQLYIGGDFELPTGALRKNIAIYNPNGMIFNSHFGCPTPVNCFEIYNQELYAGCDFINGSDSCAISKLTIDAWETIIKPDTLYSFSGNHIKSMVNVGQEMHLFGDFSIYGLMFSSKHHAVLKLQSALPYIVAGVNLNYPANAAIKMNNRILFGGQFTQNNVWSTSVSYANRVAYINSDPLLVDTKIVNENAYIFPNPVSNEMCIQSIELTYPLQIIVTNLIGETIWKAQINSEKVNLSHLQAGMYVLSIVDSKKQTRNIKFIKQ